MRLYIRKVLAALLSAAILLCPAALAEELGELDLFAPEIYAGDGAWHAAPGDQAPEAPAEPVPDVPGEPAPEAPIEPLPDVSAEPAPDVPMSIEPQSVEPTSVPGAFPTGMVLGVGEVSWLDGFSLSGGQPVSFISSKPRYVAVDANGVVTALRKGASIVSCCLGDVPLASCEVTVLRAPRKVLLPAQSTILSAGEARPFAASLPRGSAGTVYYASDNPDVLAVNGDGLLHGVSGGVATLTAASYNGKTAHCVVRVLAGPAPSWIGLEPGSLLLPVKGAALLTARYNPGCDAVLSYATSNRRIARVDENGTVTALKAGEAVITVTTHNGLTASCPVQVYTAPSKVSLNVKKLSLNLNDAYPLVATLPKYSLSSIAWSSSNPAVASVDESGMVVAVGPGTAEVTATAENGKRAKCRVTVRGLASVPSASGENIIFQEDRESLKVKVVLDHGLYLTYIWVQDPLRQLVKYYRNGKLLDAFPEAVAVNGLQDKIVIGFNSSPPVNEYFRPDWNKDPVYHNREPSPLLIANGELLANDPTKVIDGKFLFWMDGSGQLRSSDRLLEEMTVEERAALYQQALDSGAWNTFVWQPLLISDYQAVPLTEKFLKRHTQKEKKQALCQIDTHNFILVTSSDSGAMWFPAFQQRLLALGAKTAIAFDAGASTTLLIKSGSSQSFERITGGGRQLTLLTYFTEL